MGAGSCSYGHDEAVCDKCADGWMHCERCEKVGCDECFQSTTPEFKVKKATFE
jgi:hypothetical protein